MANPGERTIGGYRVDRRIRTARHVVVYEGEDRLGRRIELTCYDSLALSDRTTRQAFLDEARHTAALHHENLCLLVDAGEEEGVWFTASVAPDGPSLREIIDRGGPLAEERVALLARTISDALTYLSRAGLRHGDLRPETVFLAHGQVLLAPRRLIPLALTERDPRYLAPEEIRIEGTDLRTDFFCLGELLSEAVSGQPAFPAATPEEALARISQGLPPLPPTASPALRGLISVLLSPRPEDRPADPGTIDRILSGEIVLALPGAAPIPEPAAPPAYAPAAPSYPAPAAFSAAAPALPAAPAAVPPRPTVRRNVGRLLILTDKEPATFDLLDGSTFLAPGTEGGTSVSEEDSPAAVARIDRGLEGDLLVGLPGREPRVRVNGSLVDQHWMVDGDRIGVGEAEITYDTAVLERPAAPAAPPRGGPRRALILSACGLCVLVLLAAFYRAQALRAEGREAIAESETLDQRAAAAIAAQKSARDAGNAGTEAAAERAFRAVEDKAKQRPDSYDSNRKAFAEVDRQYPATVFGSLAAREAERCEERRQEELTRLYEDLDRKAGILLEANQIYGVVLLYRNFATDHPETIYADRAEREAASLSEFLDRRFADDLARGEAAVAARDFGVALDVLGAVEIYGSPEMKDRASARAEEVRKLVQETQVPGGEGPAPPPGESPPPGPGPTSEPPPPEPPPPEPPAKSEDEILAEKLLGEARVQMQKQKWDEALSRLDRLAAAPLATTRFGLDHATEIEKMRALARLERDGAAALFHGEVKLSHERDVTIRYLFQTAEEEQDWTFIKPFADPGLGSFEKHADGVLGRGVAAFVHSAVFEATTLRMYAKIQAVEPHDFGLMFFEPEEMMRFFLFTVQNRYFTIGIDRQPLHENAVWVFGGGAWRDTQAGNIGFVKKATNPNPPVTAGEWIDMEAVLDKDRVGMTLKKSTTIQGSALGDDGYRFPGLRPALYVLTSKAIFKEVVLTGTLEDGWLRGVLRREREKLTR